MSKLSTEVRALKDEELEEAFYLMAEAYPGFRVHSAEDRANILKRYRSRTRDKRVTFYGAFRKKVMVGMMRLHDFTMNVRGAWMPAGGVGAVAVHLAHKHQHVAKDMMDFYLRHYFDKKAPLAVLWPFRTDFYHNMGFGLGARMFQYRIAPASFPKASMKHVRYLEEDDLPSVNECYNRFAERRTGMIRENELVWRNRMAAQKHMRWAGYVQNGQVRGYVQYQFDADAAKNFIVNDLEVLDLVYDDREVLSELLEFLRVQDDQIRRVVFNTPDDDFYFLLGDVRDDSEKLLPSVNHQSHVAGVGIMYRVLKPKQCFDKLAKCDFGGVTATVTFNLTDTFFPTGAGKLTVQFTNGHPKVVKNKKADFTVTLPIAEFSSLLMGAIGFRELHLYRLAEISDDAAIDTLDRLFATRYKPLTVTPF